MDRAERGGDAGFSLVEVAVALVVLTVALTGIVHALGGGVATAGAARRLRAAREHARAEVVRLDALPASEIVASGGWVEVVAGCRRRVVVWSDSLLWYAVEVVCAPERAAGVAGRAGPGRALLVGAR